MNTHVTPILKNIVTDTFSGLVNFQNHTRCANNELEVVDCLEAYGGLHVGQTKCRILIDDFRECVLRSKQQSRRHIMINERDRQVDDGERDPADRYAKAPRLDAY